MTTVYEAIMKAADHIERNPEDFNFMSVAIPSCGTPGCALGWIGSFGGLSKGSCGFSDAATDLLKLEPELLGGSGSCETSEFAFYNRMDALCGNMLWRKAAHVCADALRKYAEKYHAPKGSLRALTAVDESFVQLPAFITAQPKRDLIPAGVREIFSRTYTAKDLTV